MHKTITILVPAYNEEESIPILYKRLKKVEKGCGEYRFNYLFVNDGSTDATEDVLRAIASMDSAVTAISLSRNFGKEAAMLAGLDYATGDAVVIMDADLQHPPEVIPEFIEKWEEGYNDVYGKRSNRKKDSLLHRLGASVYYTFLQAFVKYKVYRDIGDFRLIDRRCVEAIREVRESSRSTKNIFAWIGFKKTAVSYEVAARAAGKSKWNLWKLFGLTLDSLTSFTIAPLSFGIVIGGLLMILAIAAIPFFGFINGWVFTSLQMIFAIISFFAGLNLLMIGIMGQYIGRNYIESKNRPPYLVEDIIGSQEDE